MTRHLFARSVATGLLALTLVVSVPRPAHAIFGIEDITFDPTTFVQELYQSFVSGELNIKEFVLDVLVRQAAETARRSIIRSIINWANSGFEGSPAFVTDLERNLQGLGDYVADSFMAELTEAGVINSPFRDQLVRELRRTYRLATADNSYFERNRYTLDRYSSDPDALYRGDLAHGGGIRGWIHAWMNPQNNPIGALGAARRELEGRVLDAASSRRDEVNRNGGFLDFCRSSSTEEGGEGGEGEAEGEGEGEGEGEESGGTSLRPAVVGCRPGETRVNLGTITHDAIEKSIGSDIDMVVSADEISEIFTAIINGILVRTFSDGGGLLGLSEASSDGRSALDEVTDTDDIGDGSVTPGIINGQIGQLEQYKENWSQIKGAAERAKTNCESKATPAVMEEIDDLIATSTAEIARADAVIAELEEIQAKFTPTGGEDPRLAYEQYQELLASGRIPTISEMQYAALQSFDSPSANPPTLYTRMDELAESPSCQT